jgi:hypothetical protein
MLQHLFTQAQEFGWDWTTAYGWATLARIARNDDDAMRQDLIGDLPDLFRVTDVSVISLFFDAVLLQFTYGDILVLGGTKPLGWPGHFFFPAQLPAIFQLPSANLYFGSFLPGLVNNVQPLLAGRENLPMLVMGHSLGGAVAVLINHLLKINGRPKTAAVTFGCPRIGNQVLSDGIQGRHWRFFNEWDWIPLCPPSICTLPSIGPLKLGLIEYVQHGTPIFLWQNHPAELFRDTWGQHGWCWAHWVGMFNFPFDTSAHGLAAYAERIKRNCRGRTDAMTLFWDRCHRTMNDTDGVRFSNDPPFDLADGTTEAELVGREPVYDYEASFEQHIRIFASYAANASANPPAEEPERVEMFPYVNSLGASQFAGIAIRLATGLVPNEEDSEIESLQECSFPGYEPLKGPIWIEIPGPAPHPERAFYTSGKWVYRGTGIVQDVTGYFLTGDVVGGGERVLYAKRFRQPVPMQRHGNTLIIGFEVGVNVQPTAPP